MYGGGEIKHDCVECDASTHFRNKKKAYLKVKIEESETNSNIKNFRDLYRGINDFKKVYQPITNVVKDEKRDLVADSYSIVATWRNHFSQLLNVHGVNDIKHTAEPLMPEPSAFEVELATKKLKSHKLPGIDQIPAELRQGAEQFAMRSINLLFLFGTRMNCLRSGRSQSLYLSIRRAIKWIVIIEAYHFCQLLTKFYPTSCC